MRRLLVLLAALAVPALLAMTPATAAASFTCTPTMDHGGEHAPQFLNSGTQIHGPVLGGYNCTKAYTANVFSQYESSGTWHNGVNGSGAVLQHNHGAYPCCAGHLWTEATQTPVVGSGVLLPCSYNWRYDVFLYSTDGLNVQEDVSPELFNTC